MHTPKISISLGPGHHGDRMAALLAHAGLLHQAVRSWPDLRVDRAAAGQVLQGAPRPAYRLASQLGWALWCRVPVLGRSEAPRAPLNALFDHLAARALEPCDLYIGWSQLSLRSLQRARALGARTVLEHPMAHVDTWMSVAQAQYRRFHLRTGYALFPAPLCRRMRAECLAADHVFVLSSYAAQSMIQAGVPRRKIVTLPMGVDPTVFHPGPRHLDPHLQAQARSFRVLFVGRLELLKGLPTLLDAFLSLRLPDAQLWLAGPPLPETQALLRKAPPSVRVLGEVPPKSLPALYREADVLAFPTLCDAFGLVLLEAMASGLPVIATTSSGAPDIVTHGRDGLLCPPGDAQALAEHLLSLYRDREQARALGAAGRERALAHFTWDHYQERLLQALGAVLAEGKQALDPHRAPFAHASAPRVHSLPPAAPGRP